MNSCDERTTHIIFSQRVLVVSWSFELCVECFRDLMCITINSSDIGSCRVTERARASTLTRPLSGAFCSHRMNQSPAEILVPAFVIGVAPQGHGIDQHSEMVHCGLIALHMCIPVQRESAIRRKTNSN